MSDWDYTFECPKCGEEYCEEFDSDFENEIKIIACDECGTTFVIKARANVKIDVEINPKQA